MQEHNHARQEIAAQLRQVRKEQGMTQERLAEKSVPESQIFPVWRAGDIIRVWTFWKKLQEDLAGRLR